MGVAALQSYKITSQSSGRTTLTLWLTEQARERHTLRRASVPGSVVDQSERALPMVRVRLELRRTTPESHWGSEFAARTNRSKAGISVAREGGIFSPEPAGRVFGTTRDWPEGM